MKNVHRTLKTVTLLSNLKNKARMRKSNANLSYQLTKESHALSVKR